MQRPPSPSNKVAVNLVRQQSRQSIISPPILSTFRVGRRPSYHPPSEIKNTANYQEPNPNNFQNQLPFRESVLIAESKKTIIVGLFLYIVMMILILAEVTTINWFISNKSWIHILTVILSADIIISYIFRISGILPILTLQNIFKGIGQNHNHQTNYQKRFKNDQTKETLRQHFQIAMNNQLQTSWLKVILLFVLTIQWYIFISLSYTEKLDVYKLVYSLTILPIVSNKLKMENTSKKTKVLLYVLAKVVIFCVMNFYLITACWAGILIAMITKDNPVLIGLSHYFRLALFILLVIWLTIQSEGLSTSLIFQNLIDIGVICIGIMLTRLMAQQLIRKQLYTYRLADYVLDCSLCLIPVILMVFFSSEISYEIIGGCLILLTVCFYLKDQSAIILEVRPSTNLI